MKIEEDFIDQESFLNQKNDKKQKHPSQFIGPYLKFFEISHDQVEKQKQSMMHCVEKFLIVDYNQPFRNEVLMKIINTSKKFQFIEIEVNIGNFIFPKISIMNTNIQSPTHFLHHQRNGNFAKVYRAYCYEQQIAIKCCQYSKQNFNTVFSDVLKEFCLAKIGSLIGAGPLFREKMGYHIMVYKDCIQFAMQYCQQVTFGFSFEAKEQQQLRQSLKNLHLINLIHLDIKHENICFSTYYQKFIFIDYGLSLISNEGLGQKSLTGFAGTHYYCGQEMKKLQRSAEGFVDLYYNDVCCLSKIFQTQKKDNISADFNALGKVRKNLFGKIEDITSFHVKYLIRFQIFNLEINKAKLILTNFQIYFSNIQRQQMYEQFLQTLEIHLKDQLKNGQQDSTQNLGMIVERFNQINIMNSTVKLDTWIQDKNYQRKILLEQLCKVSINSLQNYFLILSKAIKLKSAKYSFQQKRIISRKAIQILKFLNLINQFQFNDDENLFQLKFLSNYLLKYCFNPLSSTKIPIFCNIIVNNVILKTLNAKKILEYLTLISSSNIIDDFAKIKMIVELYKAKQWIYYLSNQYSEFQKSQKIIIKSIQEFLSQLASHNQIAAHLNAIFSEPTQDKNQNFVNQLQKFSLKEQNLFQQINLLKIHQKCKQIMNNFQHKKQMQQTFIIFEHLRKRVIKSYYSFEFCADYYHLYALMILCQEKRRLQLNKLTSKLQQLFPIQQIQFSSLQIFKNTIKMQIMTINSIQNFSNLISLNQGAVFNKYFTRLIFFVIQNILTQYYQLFLQISRFHQINIFGAFFSIFTKNNFQQDDLQHQIRQLILYAKNAYILKRYFSPFIVPINCQNGFQKYMQNLLKYYYSIIRKRIGQNLNTKNYFCIFSILAELFLFKQDYQKVKQIIKILMRFIKLEPNIPSLFYQDLSQLLNKDPYFQVYKDQILHQIYHNYMQLLDKKQIFYILFKKKKVYYQLFQFLYQSCSIKEVSSFINKVSMSLLVQRRSEYVKAQIQIFTFFAWENFKKKNFLKNFIKKSQKILEQIQPIIVNPYNCLFYYRMIFLKIIKPNKSLFIQIFKSFKTIETPAKKYICKFIFQNYLDAQFVNLRKRQIKKLLIKIVKQSEHNISRSTFIKLLLCTDHSKSIHNQAIKNKLKCIFDIQFNPSFQYNAYRQKSQIFDSYILKYIQYMRQLI